MAKGMLGEMIAKYRKEARLTQEELGKMVGVSTQAVSRWECGGTPDVELLPIIADCLHVSIDALYGRDGREVIDIKELLYQNVLNLPKEQCMNKILEYIWTMQKGALINGMPEIESALDMTPTTVKDRSEEDPNMYPTMILLCDERSYMLYSTVKDRPFAAVFSEPEGGFASALKNPEEYVRLFTLLAKPHYLDMLIDLNKRKPEEYFTARSAAVRLGIPETEAREMLEELYIHMMVQRMEVADENGTMGVYSKNPNTNLYPFLFFCDNMMCSAEAMYMNADIRKIPVFKDTPGTGSLAPAWNLRERKEESE